MPKHKVEVIQVFKMTRSVVVEIEAETLDDALELASDEYPLPQFDDARWGEIISLENEEVVPAYI